MTSTFFILLDVEQLRNNAPSEEHKKAYESLKTAFG
jgi:hypothetical protein